MDAGLHRRGVLRPKQVRAANSAVVLQLLRRFDRMSRAEVARQSGLTEGTVSRIVAELMEEGFICEVGAENSTGGRPATRLQLSDAPLTIGVEIQNWETRFAVATMRGRIVESTAVRTPPTPAATIAAIAEAVNQYREKYPSARVQGVGVTARGIVNSDTGVVEMGNDPAWVNVPLQERLETVVGIPVYVENDVRAAGLAEYHYTNAGEYAPHCLLYVRVDEGVGVAIILNGNVYAGTSMSAGEFGQMVIMDQGGPERHDRPGCLEKLVSNPAICDRYAERIGRRRGTSADSAARVRRICQRAMDGDPDSRAILTQTARYLGLGVSNIAWGLNPEVIILNATINVAWPLVLPVIQAQFPQPVESPSFLKLLIRQSGLGEDGTLIGAAALAFAPLFDSAPAPGRGKRPGNREAAPVKAVPQIH